MYIGEELLSDPSFAKFLLWQDPVYYRHLSAELRNDKELALTALFQAPWNFDHISINLQQDQDIIDFRDTEELNYYKS
jgi:hypothetical protein